MAKQKQKKLGAIEGWRVLDEYEDDLLVPVSPEGVAERLEEMRQLEVEIETNLRIAREVKARTREPLMRQKQLLTELVSGKHEQRVQCTAYIDPEDKKVRVVRHDTGAVHEEREAEAWESQRRLDDDPDFAGEGEDS